MRRFRSTSLALTLLLILGTTAAADPISLYIHEGGSSTASNVGGAIFDGDYNLSYSSSGGSIPLGYVGSLGITSSAVSYPWPPPQYSTNGTFGLLIGVAAPGSTDNWTGPFLDVTGTITGSITGPQGLPGRWSGGYTGTATSVTLDPLAPPQAISQLPAPLLDILQHPDHLHFQVVVDDGNQNMLDATLTFDPPSATEAPEPSAVVTLVVGLAGLALRRRIGRPRAGRMG